MKKIAIALVLAILVLVACVNKHIEETNNPETQPDCNISVFAVFDEDMEALEPSLTLRSRLISLSDTAGVNSMLSENKALLDSLGLGSAWIVSSDTNAMNLMLYRDTPVLVDTLHKVDLYNMPGDNDKTLVSFKFHNIHDWQTVTTEMRNHHLVFSLNGEVVDATLVNNPVDDGQCSLVLPSSMTEKLFGEIIPQN